MIFFEDKGFYTVFILNGFYVIMATMKSVNEGKNHCGDQIILKLLKILELLNL
jgi:hypothetical protein